MSLQGISSHGTIIRVKPSIADPTGAAAWTAGTWYTIAELGDLSGLGTDSNEFEITSHNRNIDTWVLGVLRRQPITFPMFFNQAIVSHRLIRALSLNQDVTTKMTNGFELSSPDGEVWLFSGGVKTMSDSAPVDGVKTAQVTVRATGEFILNGIQYG